ncbi:MAG: hypothetical protein U5K32_01805 [Bacteroidales bacterium]|nr:hypothetical protein [Bacteroidales bacterium]
MIRSVLCIKLVLLTVLAAVQPLVSGRIQAQAAPEAESVSYSRAA